MHMYRWGNEWWQQAIAAALKIRNSISNLQGGNACLFYLKTATFNPFRVHGKNNGLIA